MPRGTRAWALAATAGHGAGQGWAQGRNPPSAGRGAWAPFVIGPEAIQGASDGLRARPIRVHAQGHAGVGAGGHGGARRWPGMGAGAQPTQCGARLPVMGEAAQEGAAVGAGAGRRDCAGASHSGRATAGRKRGERRAPQ
nr:fibroin heavy chain-like [Aegilops tauschii subsp. strangulata]